MYCNLNLEEMDLKIKRRKAKVNLAQKFNMLQYADFYICEIDGPY